MINPNKLILIIVVFVNYSFSEEVNKCIFNTNLPRIELEANSGLLWFGQIKGNINITNNIYSNFRVSETLFAYEYGFSAGYQRLINRTSRLQIGIGYSNGTDHPSGPDQVDTTEDWNGLIIETNYIHYFNYGIVRIGYNLGFNFIIASNKSIPSLNLGLIIGAF